MGRYDALLEVEEPKKAPVKVESKPVKKKPPTPPSVKPKPIEIKKDENIASKNASVNASTLANNQDSVIEVIRKSVRHVGKEITFVRLTPEEKAQLADIVYTYKRQGTRTSENEVARIGLNHLIEDYKANGETSILAKVMAALNA